jgi:hypothetical protein
VGLKTSQINVKFKTTNGSDICGGFGYELDPYQARTIDTKDLLFNCLGNGFVGSANIYSLNQQPLAVISNQYHKNSSGNRLIRC